MQTYTFFLLIVTLATGGQSYTKAVVYNNLNACQEQGQKIPAPGAWRCAALTIAENDQQIVAKVD